MNGVETKFVDATQEAEGLPELKAAVDVEARTVRGYANVTAVLDRAGDIVMPGAFARIGKPKMMWQHRDPLGVSLSHAEDDYGLAVEGRVSTHRAGDDALALMSDGAVDSISIGYRVTDRMAVATDKVDDVLKALALPPAQAKRLKSSMGGGRLARYAPFGVRVIKAADVMEWSPVTIPANPWATIGGKRKSFSDLVLGVDLSRKDGSPDDPRWALDILDCDPRLSAAAYLLPDSKGIPLVEVVDGVPVHTPRAIREAMVAVKGGALRDHGLADADALEVLDRLALRCGMELHAPSVEAPKSSPGPDLASLFAAEIKQVL